MSGREERERAVELYFSTPMSTKQVVEHLGYPTRQCPGTVAAQRSQVCGCRPQAAHTVGGRGVARWNCACRACSGSGRCVSMLLYIVKGFGVLGWLVRGGDGLDPEGGASFEFG